MKGKGVVLGLLMSKDRSGYEIKEVFTQIFSHFFDGSYGMIYPTLRTLEKENLIKKNVVFQEGKPNKNMYEITDEGEKEFLKHLNSPIEKDIMKSDFLMRLYFGEYLTDDKIKEYIEEQLKSKEKLYEELKENYKEWKNNLSLQQQLSFDIGIAQYHSEIEVLEHYLKSFQNIC